MERHTIRIRRVGSVTFGVVLVVTGVLFLLKVFFPALDYLMIFRFWPVILILLGVEVLFGTGHKTFEVLNGQGKVIEQSKTVYDIAAIFLTMALTGFAICMGLLDYAVRYQWQ